MKFISFIIIYLFSLFFVPDSLLAQSIYTLPVEYNPVKVGEKFPNYRLVNLINYPKKEAYVSEFSGKLLIFDLWSTTCSSCIASWPKLLHLQEQFGDKLQIILVNATENEGIVRKAFERRKRLAGVNVTLPTVCEDTILGNQLFKHSGVPYVAWIDSEGYVKSITYGESVTEENIRAILNGNNVKMRQYMGNDDYLIPDYSIPFFGIDRPRNEDLVQWYSMLSRGDDKFWPGIDIHSNKTGMCYIGASNQHIIDLYRVAYEKLNIISVSVTDIPKMIPLGKIVLAVKDTTKFLHKINGIIQYDNLYNYQLITPPASKSAMLELMQLDLKRYFGFEVTWERQVKKCLVLSASDTALIRYAGKKGNIIVNANRVALNSVPVSWFIDVLSNNLDYFNSPYPIVDETNFKGRLGGIDFEANVNDYRSLNKGLKKYGMSFTLEMREIDVLVIRDGIAPSMELNGRF